MIGSELVQKYVGDGTRMVRELFEMAWSKKACIIFDEIDAIGGARFDDGAGGDNEVQRTMLINQLDRFNPRGNIKVLMATNREIVHTARTTTAPHAVEKDGSGDNEPQEDALFALLKALTQKTDVLMQWVEMYEYVKAVPQSAFSPSHSNNNPSY